MIRTNLISINNQYRNYSSLQFKGNSSNFIKKAVTEITNNTPINETKGLLPSGAEYNRAIKEIHAIKNSTISNYDLPILLDQYINNKSFAKYLMEKTYTIKHEKGDIVKQAFNATDVVRILNSGAKEEDAKYLISIVDEAGRPRFNGDEIAEISPKADTVGKLLYVEKLAKEKTENGSYKYGGYQIVKKLEEFVDLESKRPKGQGIWD